MMMKPHRLDIHGILLIDKPELLSSNTVLQHVKRLMNARKAGHMGCLDPLATGMLPVCFGEATKFAQSGLDADKCYAVTALLGVTTTTGDAQGDVIKRVSTDSVSQEQVCHFLPTLTGDLLQTPPMYSALKYQGKKLYELARAGQEVPRSARPITIHQLTLVEFSYPYAKFLVRCSKGTYIRTLIEDLGALLEVGAHVTQLRRLYTAGFEHHPMYTLEACAAHSPQARQDCLLPMDILLTHLPQVILTEYELQKLYRGQMVDIKHEFVAGCLRLYNEQNCFQGLGEWDLGSGMLKAKRLLATP